MDDSERERGNARSSRRSQGRDVVVSPWRGAWAVLKVGNKRPGRVRPTKEAAVRDGQAYARDECARLFVATQEVTFEALAAMHAAGTLDDPHEGLGPPIADLRNPSHRLEVRRAAEMRDISEEILVTVTKREA